MHALQRLTHSWRSVVLSPRQNIDRGEYEVFELLFECILGICHKSLCSSGVLDWQWIINVDVVCVHNLRWDQCRVGQLGRWLWMCGTLIVSSWHGWAWYIELLYLAWGAAHGMMVYGVALLGMGNCLLCELWYMELLFLAWGAAHDAFCILELSAALCSIAF